MFFSFFTFLLFRIHLPCDRWIKIMNRLHTHRYHDGDINRTHKPSCYDARQVAQLSQRDRAAGWVSYGQQRNTVNGRQYFTHNIGSLCLQPSWRDSPAKQSNSVKKHEIRAITPLKVIQDHRGRYQSTRIWHPISCRFGVIAACCSNFGHFCVFWATRWGLRDNVLYILGSLESA